MGDAHVSDKDRDRLPIIYETDMSRVMTTPSAEFKRNEFQ